MQRGIPFPYTGTEQPVASTPRPEPDTVCVAWLRLNGFGVVVQRQLDYCESTMMIASSSASAVGSSASPAG